MFVKHAKQMPVRPISRHSEYCKALVEEAFGQRRGAQLWDSCKLNGNKALRGDQLENAKGRMELVCCNEGLVSSAAAVEQKPSESQSACVALPFSDDVETQRYGSAAEEASDE